jgi:hypothetical protein
VLVAQPRYRPRAPWLSCAPMTTRTLEIESVKARLVRALFPKNPEPPQRAQAKRPRGSSTGVVEASRAAISVLASDCTSFVEAAARQTQRIFSVAQQKTNARTVWLPSFVARASADALAPITAARSAFGFGALGALGGLGLMGVATIHLRRARTSEERLDAGADLAWGVQGFSYVARESTLASLTTGMGFVGAAARMSVGMVRIRRGVQTGDKQAVKLGALDLGAGILWGALDVAGFSHPVVLGGYLVTMVGREAYANRDALRRALFSDARHSLRPGREGARHGSSVWALP